MKIKNVKVTSTESRDIEVKTYEFYEFESLALSVSLNSTGGYFKTRVTLIMENDNEYSFRLDLGLENDLSINNRLISLKKYIDNPKNVDHYGYSVSKEMFEKYDFELNHRIEKFEKDLEADLIVARNIREEAEELERENEQRKMYLADKESIRTDERFECLMDLEKLHNFGEKNVKKNMNTLLKKNGIKASFKSSFYNGYVVTLKDGNDWKKAEELLELFVDAPFTDVFGFSRTEIKIK